MKQLLLIISGLAAATAAPATAQLIQPGKWEMVSTPTSIDMPGAPPRMLAMMKGRPIKISFCITPEQARLGPQALSKTARNCRYTQFDVRGSRINSQMLCKQPSGAMTITATGNFTPTSFVTDGRTVMTGRRPMTTTSHTVGRRVGECGR